VAGGWLEALAYSTATHWLQTLWLLALEGSLALFFALPVAALAAAGECALPRTLLAQWAPTAERRATATGLAWAATPFLLRALGSRGLLGAAALVLLCAVPLLLARWIPAASPRIASGFTLLGAVLAHALSWFSSPTAPAPAPRLPARASTSEHSSMQPCVLLISIDTLRRDRVGAIRDGLPVTPFLDSLGKEGIATACRSAGNETGPGHAAMLTGANGLRHGVISNHWKLPASLPTLAELLQAAGWRTGAVVSNPVIAATRGYARGFECYGDVYERSAPWELSFFGLSRRSSRWAWLSRDYRLARSWMKHLEWKLPMTARGLMPNADQALQRSTSLLAEMHEAGDAWFLFTHFMDAHYPYEPPPETRGRWSSAAATAGVPTHAADAFARRRARLLQRARAGEAAALREIESMARLYDEEVAFVDSRIRDLVEAARIAAGERELWIVMTSDHGEHFLEHGKLGHSNSLYEELVQVPLILHGLPALDPDQIPQRLEDVPRLLARLLISERAADVLAEASPSFHDGESVQIWDDKASITDARWKLFASAVEFRGEYAALALWDLQSPGGEAANVIAEQAEAAAALLHRLNEAVRNSSVAPRAADEEGVDEASRVRLAQLGYTKE